MTRLAIALDRSELPNGFDESFLWDGTATDSFKSQYGPDLAKLGPVPALNSDFVRLALTVFATDHSVLRRGGGSNWNARDLFISVPVSNPSLWAGVHGELVEAINFLTGDKWTLEFTQATPVQQNASLVADSSARVVLLSGGADSGTGAAYSAAQLGVTQTHTLVSHASSGAASGPQTLLHNELERMFPGRQSAHHRVFLSRGKKRLDGTNYKVEPSSRSRSFLFLSLGLAVAAQSGSPLWIPENGFASLNPPMGPERLGSLSTRTTQPWFLWRVSEILSSIGAHGHIENPFQLKTKGEMFADLASALGRDEASAYLSKTNSCSHTDQNFQRVPSGTHCGVCFGCIVRRASFKAAGLADQTRYLGDEAEFATYAAKHSVVEAARDFATNALSNATIMTMPLPPTMTTAEAKSLCLRGQAEIRSYLS